MVHPSSSLHLLVNHDDEQVAAHTLTPPLQATVTIPPSLTHTPPPAYIDIPAHSLMSWLLRPDTRNGSSADRGEKPDESEENRVRDVDNWKALPFAEPEDVVFQVWWPDIDPSTDSEGGDGDAYTDDGGDDADDEDDEDEEEHDMAGIRKDGRSFSVHLVEAVARRMKEPTLSVTVPQGTPGGFGRRIPGFETSWERSTAQWDSRLDREGGERGGGV